MNILPVGTYKIASAFFTVQANGDYTHYNTGEVINDRVNEMWEEEGTTPEVATEAEAEAAHQALMASFSN